MTVIRAGLCTVAIACCCVAALCRAQPTIDPSAVEQARQAFASRLAAEDGFDHDGLLALLESAEINQSILDAISRPAERVVPWYEYREIFVTPSRIAAGVEFWRNHADAVRRASTKHGVDPEMLIAIVGIESLYGKRMGSYRVLDALSTLAFAYPPRSAFFSSELEAFLLFNREQNDAHIDALGSYAGAMGAGQFIPSSYRAYAVDANDDGLRDLWNDWDDILGSVANYFEKLGWREGAPVAVPAGRPGGISRPEPGSGLSLNQTVGSIRGLGYEFETGMPADAPAMLVGLEHDESSNEYWVGFRNFRVITRYNVSAKYALVAHQLADAIEAAYRGGAPEAVL
jgi:membrane-bound lytic murein transglycosylase B